MRKIDLPTTDLFLALPFTLATDDLTTSFGIARSGLRFACIR